MLGVRTSSCSFGFEREWVVRSVVFSLEWSITHNSNTCNRYDNESTLRGAAMISFCKFMCVSRTFARNNFRYFSRFCKERRIRKYACGDQWHRRSCNEISNELNRGTVVHRCSSAKREKLMTSLCHIITGISSVSLVYIIWKSFEQQRSNTHLNVTKTISRFALEHRYELLEDDDITVRKRIDGIDD